jgi:hypothetical protein
MDVGKDLDSRLTVIRVLESIHLRSGIDDQMTDIRDLENLLIKCRDSKSLLTEIRDLDSLLIAITDFDSLLAEIIIP